MAASALPPQSKDDRIRDELAVSAPVPQEWSVHWHSIESPAPTMPEPGRVWEPSRRPDAGRPPAPGVLHLWLLPHSPSDIALQRNAWVLSAHESQRAAAFANPTDRRRYVAAHAFMRAVLAHHTGIDAQALRFAAGATGKPALVPGQVACAIEFNLSHAGDLALCGVACEQPLGVDVEVVRDLDDLAALSRSSFSRREQHQFDALDPALRREAFFAAWACKEAVIKALGTGLSTEPARIEVSIDPRRARALVAIDGSAVAARDWSLWGARLSQGAWWAAACARAGMELSLWSLQADRGIVITPE